MTATAKPTRPIEELQAGDAFRDSLLKKCDAIRSAAPLWHGWAIMDAFLAGIDWARQYETATPKPTGTDDTAGHTLGADGRVEQ